MKKMLLTLVLGFVMITNLQAQLTRNLVLVAANQEAFTVYVNQTPINNRALKEVRVTGLFDNFYDISIQTVQSNRILRANLYVPPLSEIVYKFYIPTLQNAQGEFVISSLTPTPENIQGNPSSSFVFGGNGQIEGLVGNPLQNGQINININNTMDTTVVTPQESIIVSEPVAVITEEPTVVYVAGYTGNVGCQPPLSEARFSNMLSTIENQDFASSKKRIAKQVISNNCMVVSHLVEILELFDFESDKLEIAKFAYAYIYDIENYYEVNNVFDFESSIEELDDFLRTR